jgi:hypothetical protein
MMLKIEYENYLIFSVKIGNTLKGVPNTNIIIMCFLRSFVEKFTVVITNSKS